jgi:hypothetical protein
MRTEGLLHWKAQDLALGHPFLVFLEEAPGLLRL